MSLTLGLCEGVAPPEGLPLLEHLISLNLQWTLEVEQDVALGSRRARKTTATIATTRSPWTGWQSGRHGPDDRAVDQGGHQSTALDGLDAAHGGVSAARALEGPV